MRVAETAFFYKSDMYNWIAAGLFLSPVINSWLFILPTIEQKLNRCWQLEYKNIVPKAGFFQSKQSPLCFDRSSSSDIFNNSFDTVQRNWRKQCFRKRVDKRILKLKTQKIYQCRYNELNYAKHLIFFL